MIVRTEVRRSHDVKTATLLRPWWLPDENNYVNRPLKVVVTPGRVRSGACWRQRDSPSPRLGRTSFHHISPLVLLGFRLLKYPMRHSSLVLLSPLLLLSLPACALWPFKEKQFKDEAFINAGSLGLSKLDGRVAAVGDWNGDSKWVFKCWSWRLYWLDVRLDLFTLSGEAKTVQIHLWNGGWSYSKISPLKIH